MSNKRTLQELTIKDNFLFAAAMQDEENCRRLLEMVLRIPIERVEVSTEKSILYNPEYHGVRLDVYAKDEKNSHYNVEMQVDKTKAERRSRYYHAQMDMEFLQTGEDYNELPESFVIFICDYDPFGLEKYQYTVRKTYVEAPDVEYRDGIHSIFLSTKGKNKDEVPEELVKFLKFVHSDLAESTMDFEDPYVKRLQGTIMQIKLSREMGAKYMLFQELLREERLEGLKEGREQGIKEGKEQGLKEGIKEGVRNSKISDILKVLSCKFAVPENLKEKLSEIEEAEKLEELFSFALSAKSVKEFEEYLKKCGNL